MNPAPLVALVGNPNAGKSALFNALTGARQKVGNYPGVTVERKSGRMALDDGRPIEMLDLPGTYSLDPSSPDEAVTRDVLIGTQEGERRPDVLIVVVDATNLDNHLRFALQLVALGLPTIVALNMIDMAERDGTDIDVARLSAELGVPVIPTVAVRKRGLDALKDAIGRASAGGGRTLLSPTVPGADLTALQRRSRQIAAAATVQRPLQRAFTEKFDRVALHPVAGPILLAVMMFVMFQAVFSWSQAPIDWLAEAQSWLATTATNTLPDNFLRDFLVEGIINGVGMVVAFLPQILVLFAFILVLEASGYMVRAAFLMDRLMASVGLSGRAFIPLLSSFACAIPGIMATRSIDDPRDRLTTILIAPLMTCSARLPVYALIIGAFIPAQNVLPGVGLQGLVLFGLYIAGIIGAMAASAVLRRTVTKGGGGGFMMELPRYQLPVVRDIAIGLWQRAFVFLRRAGTVILTVTAVLWLLTSYPKVPIGSSLKQSEYSIAGRIAGVIYPIVRPIGFGRDMALAVIPAMVAREVAVSALQTVYSIDAADDPTQGEKKLAGRLRGAWSLPTALAFLAWFVFAPQCLSTIAVIRRETNGWLWPSFTLAYLFGMAWLAAGATFWTATALGL
ncbi:ferrous iron transporter B [Sphingomonas sp. BIUV-7]|uniref:Ferrous iron transport protein B n=1 Tax=Sphingomonas natans TaxID=3063330 RepID=A0ABT8YDC6_9SPHN|nr:ferrous iron transporter B [Sphingomonas sp. BIUV-7]MDO6416321.1 ferrous iron transporter B [Sphingomonas sp. BIUV-7]